MRSDPRPCAKCGVPISKILAIDLCVECQWKPMLKPITNAARSCIRCGQWGGPCSCKKGTPSDKEY